MTTQSSITDTLYNLTHIPTHTFIPVIPKATNIQCRSPKEAYNACTCAHTHIPHTHVAVNSFLMCGRSGKLRFYVLYVYSVVVFIGYMYSVSAQGIIGCVINARYYYYLLIL